MFRCPRVRHVLSGRGCFYFSGVEEAELLSCLEGLTLALQSISEPIILETDSMNAAWTLNSTNQDEIWVAH
jgi:hypothetical protein